MKKWVYMAIGLLIIGLMVTVWIQKSRISNLKEDLSYSIANEKAMFAERDSLEKNNRVLYLTVEQLNFVNDSIIEKMNGIRNLLKIKDKEIQELYYQLSTASVSDTLILRDTLFRDPELNIDTTMKNKWYNIGIHLEYPSSVVVSPSFTSERYVNMVLKKETIKPPKKCRFLQWFQRKHKVMIVEVEEMNPYIKLDKEKYIKVVK